MPPPYRKHVLVCTSCGPSSPGAILLAALKDSLGARGLLTRVCAQESPCLDGCDYEDGVMVVYPDAVWYGRVGGDDVEEIVERHLVGGEPVARKRIDFARRTVGGAALPPPES